MDKINRDKTYNYLLDEFGKEKLENRFLFLYTMANTFIRDRKIGEITGISFKVLNDIVIDYFADISRLKQFHKINKINEIKIAAYISFWINKRKPLFIHSEITREIILEKPYLDHINEWFCVFIIISILYDAKQPIEHGMGEYVRFSSFINLLVYNFSYRILTAQSIELALMGAETKQGYIKINDPVSD